MFEEIFNDKNQKRRKGSMLKNSIVAIRYFLVLLFLVVMPIKAWGGISTIPDTDFPEDQLYFFWDLRGRESFFQVTNTDSAALTVHIQVFNAATGCTEFDYDDDFTGFDTHLYDVSKLTRNNPLNPLVGPPDLTDGYGFVVVSTSTVTDGDVVLIGNFRVIDDEGGYEYRTNAAGNYEAADTTSEYTFNFNDIDGTIFSDVVGIPVIANGLSTVLAGPLITATFDPTLFDAAENDVSCPPVTFACAPTTFDLGINQEIVNNKEGGESSICLGTDTNGYVDLLLDTLGGGADFFVGFIGLNNGDGTGSMDAWWAIPEL